MPLGAGTRLGPYEILSALGVGGMGEVYRARDERLEREVAVKVLPEHLAKDTEALARFEREAKAVAALSHPNILAIHDFGTFEGTSFAVTELLEGETLRTRVTRSALVWRKAAEIAAALADGLAAAHSKGIVHRDLKPENIFLTRDGQVKILDFGLARFTPRPSRRAGSKAKTGMTEPGTVLGTMGYMSPEQVRGEAAKGASDIFALGCVLYEMIAGRRAFSRATPAETMAAILREEPPPLAESGKLGPGGAPGGVSAGVAGAVPADLDRVIAHCLEKNPEERFQSARDLAFALRAILSGSGAMGALAPVGTRAIDSIAVLPFHNAGRDPDAEYLSDGLTEAIINSLAQIPQLRVTPRSTVFRYKGRDVEPQAAGRELGVRAVVAGRVLERGQTLVIGAELIDVAAESQIWGERYNRPLSDIFAVEEEIARRISESLRGKLAGEGKKRLVQRSTENPEAYQFYLKGRYHFGKRTSEGLQTGIDYFQRAIETDPNFAQAYTGLADCYLVLGVYSELPASESIPKVKAAAAKALAIDDHLAEGYASRAHARWFGWDWEEADSDFRRAIELDPSYAMAHDWYALFLGQLGSSDESVREMQRAKELDPLSLVINAHEIQALCSARRYDEAIEQYRRALEMDPNFFQAHYWVGMAFVQKGMYAEAIGALLAALHLIEGNPGAAAALAHAYAVSGREAEARKLLAELRGQMQRRYIDPYFVGVIHAGLGDREAAMEWLGRACEEHSVWLAIQFKTDARLDGLRADPRFGELLRRVG